MEGGKEEGGGTKGSREGKRRGKSRRELKEGVEEGSGGGGGGRKRRRTSIRGGMEVGSRGKRWRRKRRVLERGARGRRAGGRGKGGCCCCCCCSHLAGVPAVASVPPAVPGHFDGVEDVLLRESLEGAVEDVAGPLHLDLLPHLRLQREQRKQQRSAEATRGCVRQGQLEEEERKVGEGGKGGVRGGETGRRRRC